MFNKKSIYFKCSTRTPSNAGYKWDILYHTFSLFHPVLLPNGPYPTLPLPPCSMYIKYLIFYHLPRFTFDGVRVQAEDTPSSLNIEEQIYTRLMSFAFSRHFIGIMDWKGSYLNPHTMYYVVSFRGKKVLAISDKYGTSYYNTPLLIHIQLS